jgi:hypothetical protein
VVDGRETKVEVIGTLSLLLHDDFSLTLNNVLYVPLLRRNLFFVASLEDNECLVGNNKYIIKFNDVIVGLT